MYRDQMPRLYELRDLIEDPAHPDAYFQNFDRNLAESPHHIRPVYLSWEKQLQGLDDNAWEYLKNEARPYLTRRDPKGRGWQQLSDCLGQARAFNFLKDKGCTDVRFIQRADKNGLRTPDLEGNLGHGKVLCEVKTINISEEEVHFRNNPGTRKDGTDQLSDGFFRKLHADITQGQSQLDAYDAGRVAEHYVFIVIHFDDILGEYKQGYFAQIDQSLSKNGFPGVNLVFYNARTPFHTNTSMVNAMVVNELSVIE